MRKSIWFIYFCNTMYYLRIGRGQRGTFALLPPHPLFMNRRYPPSFRRLPTGCIPSSSGFGGTIKGGDILFFSMLCYAILCYAMCTGCLIFEGNCLILASSCLIFGHSCLIFKANCLIFGVNCLIYRVIYLISCYFPE